MRILAPITLFDALRDWGLHEAEGRLRAMRLIDPALVDALRRGGEDMAICAAEICLQVRSPVIVRVLAADPVQYVRVELTCEDIDQLFVMSAEGQLRRPLGLDAEERAGGPVRAFHRVLADRDSAPLAEVHLATVPHAPAGFNERSVDLLTSKLLRAAASGGNHIQGAPRQAVTPLGFG